VHEALLVQPDTRFIHDVMASGGADLKKCMQCGTCSAVCTLAPDDATFPRKQMLEAQWGLKDRLAGDPAIWLCHNCGDCSTYCPRGAHPGEVFGALRQATVENLAFPRFLGRMVGSPKALAALLLFPALIFLGMARWAPRAEPSHNLEFANVFPIPWLETLFFALSGFVLLIFGIGLTRLLMAFRAYGAGGITPGNLWAAVVETMTNERFSKCGTHKSRRLGHIFTLWGFVGLAMTGTAVGLGTMVGIMHTPLALTSPWKVFANVSAAVILIGSLILLVDRIKDPVQRAASTYFDWFFLITLTGVVVTGISAELLRLGQAAGIMYAVYYIHLVLIFALFLYAPYSKFAHFAYRTVAMAAAKGGGHLNGVMDRRKAA
jgi:quinone-modifying oxidoreductase subunit QmoC